MPALLERIFPFLGRRHTKQGFLSLAKIAIYFAHERKLDPRILEIWRKISFLAAHTLMELFVENAHPHIDWDLKRHWKRIDMINIIELHYWMTLYFLASFKRFGGEGYDVNRDFSLLRRLAEAFPLYVKALPRFNIAVPRAFSDTWADDSQEKLAFDLCLAMHNLLSLTPSPVVRSVGVVKFLLATRDAYRVSVSGFSKVANIL